jgi:hypothetical protein
MKIVKDEKKIKRYSVLGQMTSLGGLAILAGGMFISFRYPDKIGFAWLALLIGFTFTGNFLLNPWAAT